MKLIMVMMQVIKLDRQLSRQLSRHLSISSGQPEDERQRHLSSARYQNMQNETLQDKISEMIKLKYYAQPEEGLSAPLDGQLG